MNHLTEEVIVLLEKFTETMNEDVSMSEER